MWELNTTLDIWCFFLQHGYRKTFGEVDPILIRPARVLESTGTDGEQCTRTS